MTDQEIRDMVAKMTEHEADTFAIEIGYRGDRILTWWKLEDMDCLRPRPTPEQFKDFAPWAARKGEFSADWEGLWEWFCESNDIVMSEDDEDEIDCDDDEEDEE